MYIVNFSHFPPESNLGSPWTESPPIREYPKANERRKRAARAAASIIICRRSEKGLGADYGSFPGNIRWLPVVVVGRLVDMGIKAEYKDGVFASPHEVEGPTPGEVHQVLSERE